ncbi:MAG: cell division protein ZapA [Rikenellaceae bacterium]|nr:cell division protein ZapA [Rikenellaceae bacterium]MDE7355918.1 cell division protein ZapA [Rikenellaceae bacterium]
MGDDSKLVIRIKLGEREYSMSVDRDNPTKEHNIRKAAKIVGDKYTKYMTTRQGLEPIDCYALLALEMSVKNIELQTKSEEEKIIEKKLEELESEIDSALSTVGK